MNLIICILNVLLLSLLSACSYNHLPYSRKSTTAADKVQLPKIPLKPYQPGLDTVWHYIGKSQDSKLIAEIDTGNISKTSNPKVYQFRDRKTITDPKSFDFGSIQPKFKYVISHWQINCESRQYVVLNATTYDAKGIQLTTVNYANNPAIKWLKIGNNSIANSQYDFICKNKDRNLSY